MTCKLRALGWFAPVCLTGWLLAGEPGPDAAANDQAARDRAVQLRREIAHHDALYFREAAPEVTDAEYDALARELRDLETAHPELAVAAAGPGDDRSGRWPVVRHRARMLSLDKAYTESDWRAFHAEVVRKLGRADVAFVVEPKYDGLAVSLTYAHGTLVRAATRGNGDEGEDVTANVRLIPSVPCQLRSETLDGAPNPIPDLVELRGEVYVDEAEFLRINRAREASGAAVFAHPRNLAAGTLKSREAGEPGERRLSIVFFGWGAWEGAGAPLTQQQFHRQVSAWGLRTVHLFLSGRSADEVWAAVHWFEQQHTRFDFPTDGAVVKLDEVAPRARLGESERAPRWAIACKFAPATAWTRVRDITLQVGRTGVLSPVAELEPVEVGGAIVSRVTLFNRREIARRDVRIGDTVEIERAGQVIPAIVRVDASRRAATSRPYEFPSVCPSCGRPVAEVPDEAAVRCPNLRCPAQVQRRLEHFASAEALALDGFGPATIRALVEAGLLAGVADFYRLRAGELAGLPGLGPVTAARLMAALERSRRRELRCVLYGLGIPRIGAVGAGELAARCRSLAGFARMTDAEAVQAVGAAGARELRLYLDSADGQAEVRALAAAGLGRSSPREGAAQRLRGKIVVFTGTMQAGSRAVATERVRAAGGTVRESVSRRTDYVVAGIGAGEKLDDARQLGVPVLSEAEFERLLAGE